MRLHGEETIHGKTRYVHLLTARHQKTMVVGAPTVMKPRILGRLGQPPVAPLRLINELRLFVVVAIVVQLPLHPRHYSRSHFSPQMEQGF